MTESTKLFPLDGYSATDSVGYLLSRTKAKLARSLDMALAEHDITHTQGGIILLLATGKYTTAAELSRDLYIDSASMTRMIDRLEARELITRQPSSEDRRITTLQLTKDGKALSKRLPAMYIKVMNQSFAGFTKDDIHTLKGLLRKFLSDGKEGAGDEH
jgi:DNA-binding MarR family transcriptional regulator